MEIFMVASTTSTEDFLEEGGFMDMYVKEEEKWDVFLDQLSGNKKLIKDEQNLLKRTPAHKREKNLLLLLISAISISFLFTLVSIIKEAWLEPDYVPADEFKRKMEQLQEQYLQENQLLRNQLQAAQKQLDSLKN
jgi:hypothetical protein